MYTGSGNLECLLVQKDFEKERMIIFAFKLAENSNRLLWLSKKM